MAGLTVLVSPGACKACQQSLFPQAKNKVTCDIAIGALRQVGKPLTTILKLYLEDKAHDALLTANVFNRPGMALRKILANAVSDRTGCGCDEYAALMDSWGTEGCILRRGSIIEHLNGQSATLLEMFRIALTGHFTTGQLVDSAIEDSRCSNEPM